MIRWLFLSLALAGAGAAHAEDAALFKADRLTLPRVDGDGQVAQYQNAALARLPSGDFRLEGVDVLDAAELYRLPGIQTVEVRTVGTLPVAVLLRVNGVDPSCDHVSPLRYAQRLTGQRFDVVISSQHAYALGQVHGCTNEVRPFRLTVPLDVYGLAAGTYTFTVNGVQSGQFTLAAENRYPDDCHPTLERRCPR